MDRVQPEMGISQDRLFAARIIEQGRELLAGIQRLGVAFSGGVDSSVLLALAVKVLSPTHVVAILGVSPSLAADERTTAHQVARYIGVDLVEVNTQEGSRLDYVANGPDRCFHCKDELFTCISDEMLASHRLDAVAYGENADDAKRPDRPGARAATIHQVLRPLAVLGLDKVAVRRLARVWQLPCAEKPAAPCLASRIPHYQPVTPEKLRQIEQAEAALRALGFGDLRVRHHDDIARIELPPADLPRTVSDPMRGAVVRAALDAGFRYAVEDLSGMQSGLFTLTVLEDVRETRSNQR
jgi:uncharacterized protein